MESVPHLTPPQIETASKGLIQLLSQSPPEQLRQILRGIIHQITAERDGNIIRGIITYYYPPPFDFAPIRMLPKEPTPMGAQLYRQIFSYPFEAKIRSL